MGRFMSPDDNDNGDYSDPSNPQSWNLYSYVRNNPLTNTDPDGHDCVVQSRASDTTETVSVSTGTCAGVNVGSGQSATYVNGTVTGYQTGADGHSLDIGFNSYDGGSSGVQNAAGAPSFNNPGIDGPANAAVFGRIGNQGMNAIGAFAAGSVVAGVTGGVGLYAAGSGAGLTTLGDLSLNILTNQDAGAIIGWGTSQSEAGVLATRQLAATLTEQDVAAMEAKGLNPATAQKLLNVYERAVAAGKAGGEAGQAGARKELMIKIIQFMKQ